MVVAALSLFCFCAGTARSLSTNNTMTQLTAVILDIQRQKAEKYQEYVNYVNDVNCMSEALYFEARNQPDNGVRAVAHVILNRARGNTYHGSVCDVVHQRVNGVCQFSYYCQLDANALRPREHNAYDNMRKIADSVISNEDYDFTNGSEFYHTVHITAKWDKIMNKTLTISDHVFFKLKPGKEMEV